MANPTASGVLSNPALLGQIQGFEVFTESALILQKMENSTTRNKGIDPNTDAAYRPSQTSRTRPIGLGAMTGKTGQWGWGFFVRTPIQKGANFEEITPGSAPTSHQRYAVLQAEVQSIDFGVASGIQVLDWLSVGFIPTEQVDRWTASWQFDIGDLTLPAGQETTLDFECGFTQEVSLLSMGGLMHEYGLHEEVDLLREGLEERIYEVEHWEPEYRDYPPLTQWAPDALQIGAEDSLSVHCTWENTEENDLAFPQEMCTEKVLVLDAEKAIFCVNGMQMGQE